MAKTTATNTATTMVTTMNKSKCKCPFVQIPDDLVAAVATAVGLYCDPQSFVRLSRTCQRVHRIMSRPLLLTEIVRGRGVARDAYDITTLSQWAVFEEARQLGFLEENRVGFQFATMAFSTSDGSMGRIRKAQDILRKFQCVGVEVVLDGHCGLPAPAPIAPTFSHHRGLTVRGALLAPLHERLNSENMDNSDSDDNSHADSDDDIEDQDPWIVNAERIIDAERISVQAWGRRAAMAAAESDHHFSGLAKEGKGWVEITFRLEGRDGSILEIPSRPSFYQRLLPHNVNEMEIDEEDWWVDRDEEEEEEDEEAESSGNEMDNDEEDEAIGFLRYPVDGRG